MGNTKPTQTAKTYTPYVRWDYPLRMGKLEIHEIGYDTKTKEVVLLVRGDAVFRIRRPDEIYLAQQKGNKT